MYFRNESQNYAIHTEPLHLLFWWSLCLQLDSALKTNKTNLIIYSSSVNSKNFGIAWHKVILQEDTKELNMKECRSQSFHTNAEKKLEHHWQAGNFIFFSLRNDEMSVAQKSGEDYRLRETLKTKLRI